MAKFGINLLLWTAQVDRSLRPLLERIKSWEYDGVEAPIVEPDEAELKVVAGMLDDLGLERTSVTVCSVDNNPASPDIKVRQAAVERLKRIVDASHALGAKLLCGPIHSALGHFTGQGPSADERKWAMDSLREVAPHAEQADITLTVEYLNRFECYLLNHAADTAAFVREIDHPRVRMMYDTFHAHIEEKDITAAIKNVADVLAHVHISENDRSTPGQGAVAWDDSFDALRNVGYDGWLTIEAFGLSLPELAAATKIWRRMFASDEQLAVDGLKFMKRKWSEPRRKIT